MQTLTMTRTELWKQLNTSEDLLREKKEERNQLKSKVDIKHLQLEEKTKELE